MRDAARIVQRQHDIFNSPEYANPPSGALQERFACKQCLVGIFEAIAQNTSQEKPRLKHVNICVVTTPEELRQELLNDLSRRLTTAQIGLKAQTQSERNKAQARVNVLEALLTFWTEVRIEAPTEEKAQ